VRQIHYWSNYCYSNHCLLFVTRIASHYWHGFCWIVTLWTLLNL